MTSIIDIWSLICRNKGFVGSFHVVFEKHSFYQDIRGRFDELHRDIHVPFLGNMYAHTYTLERLITPYHYNFFKPVLSRAANEKSRIASYECKGIPSSYNTS